MTEQLPYFVRRKRSDGRWVVFHRHDQHDGIKSFKTRRDAEAYRDQLNKVKQAICSKCGDKLDGMVPDDATDVVCFKCDNPIGEQQ